MSRSAFTKEASPCSRREQRPTTGMKERQTLKHTVLHEMSPSNLSLVAQQILRRKRQKTVRIKGDGRRHPSRQSGPSNHSRNDTQEIMETEAACTGINQMGSQDSEGSRHKLPSLTWKLTPNANCAERKTNYPTGASLSIQTLFKGRLDAQR